MKILFVILVILKTLALFYGLYRVINNDSKGSVYWMNFKPESKAFLEELASTYEDETGVKVKIYTPASGKYNEELGKELETSSPPTLFVAVNQETVNKYSEYFYDLSKTKVAGELNTNDFNLYTPNGTLAAIGYCYETFGIIANLELLEKANHNIEEITNFNSLKTVVEDIHNNAQQLGFDAFTSSGLDDSSSWRFTAHLANVPLFYESRDAGYWKETPEEITGSYLTNFKNIWDLYINNAAADPSKLSTGNYNAEEEFGKKQAVFYQNGNWEYENLVNTYSLDDKNLKMIPIYCGVTGEENAGLNSGTENYWAVNAKADKKDIEATLDFMYWLVTNEEAVETLAETFGSIPYKKAVSPSNVFLAQANDYINEGKYNMQWVFSLEPNHAVWREELSKALATYSASQTEDNWKLVENAFVDGWKEQYKAVNGN